VYAPEAGIESSCGQIQVPGSECRLELTRTRSCLTRSQHYQERPTSIGQSPGALHSRSGLGPMGPVGSSRWPLALRCPGHHDWHAHGPPMPCASGIRVRRPWIMMLGTVTPMRIAKTTGKANGNRGGTVTGTSLRVPWRRHGTRIQVVFRSS
jgi:hypothetical protein